MSKAEKTPQVSVIIPTYNCEKYISQAVESVLKQTYKDYEIIIVDDGSTDKTCKILEGYDRQIRYIYQDNQGSAVARNLAIDIAKGEFIAFLDADDFFLLPEKLAEQVACFEREPELGSVHTGWRLVNQEGEKISDVEPWHRVPDLNLETWLRWKPVLTSTMMIRRSCLKSAGGFDVELRQCHDVDLMLRLALMDFRATWLPQVAVCYRQHDQNITNNSFEQAKYVLRVLDKFFARNDLPEKIRMLESQVRYSTLVWIAWYQYYRNHYAEMAQYLQDSLDYTPYLKVETISDWIEQFINYSQQNNCDFNVCLLSDLFEWRTLM